MAISEDVVAKFKADTSGLEAGAKRAAGAMGGLGNAAHSAASAGSKALDGMTAGLLKFNLAVGAAQTAMGAVGKIMDAAEFAGQVRNLERLVSPDLVGRLQAASNGTIDRMTLMKEAAKSLNAQMKMTPEQMELIVKGATALGQRFGNTEQTLEKLFKAFRKGETGELREFGFAIDTTATRTVQFAQVFGELKRTISETGPMDKQTEATRQFRVQMEEGMQSLRVGLAQLMPVLVATVGTITEMVRMLGLIDDDTVDGKASDMAMDRANKRARAEGDPSAASRYYDEELAKVKKDSFSREAVFAKAKADGPRPFANVDYVTDPSSSGQFPMMNNLGNASVKGGSAGPRDTRWDNYRPGMYGSSGRKYSTTDDLVGPPMGFSSPGSGNFASPGLNDSISAMGNLRAQSSRPSEISDLFPGAGKGGFGSGFTAGMNPREEMMGLRDMGVETAGITQAATMAAIEAAVTGQGSIVKAAKAAIAAQLMSKAISWGFEGAAMLFTGNPQGAGMIALATAAAVAARSMGAGGGGPAMPSAGGGRPGGGYVGGAAARPGGNVTIVVSGGNGAQNAVAIDNALRAAKRSGLIPDSDGPGRITS
jgi:replicative DNA helicase